MGVWTSIEQSNVGIRENFGRFEGIEPSGCVFIGCWGTAIRGPVSLRTNQIQVKCDSFTKDNVSIEIDIQVQYKVNKDKIYEAYYSLEDVRAQLHSYVLDAVRDKVPQRQLEPLLLRKNEVASSIYEELAPVMEPYGYTIVQVLITEIIIDRKVKEAMNEIITAESQRTAALARAEANKTLRIKEAEAEAASKELSGKGLAAARQAIISGLRETVSDFTESFHGVDAETVMNLVLTSQYYDTLKEIGTRSHQNTIFLPPKEFSPTIFSTVPASAAATASMLARRANANPPSSVVVTTSSKDLITFPTPTGDKDKPKDK